MKLLQVVESRVTSDTIVVDNTIGDIGSKIDLAQMGLELLRDPVDLLVLDHLDLLLLNHDLVRQLPQRVSKLASFGLSQVEELGWPRSADEVAESLAAGDAVGLDGGVSEVLLFLFIGAFADLHDLYVVVEQLCREAAY